MNQNVGLGRRDAKCEMVAAGRFMPEYLHEHRHTNFPFKPNVSGEREVVRWLICAGSRDQDTSGSTAVNIWSFETS